MFRLLIAALLLASFLAAPKPARAYALSCQQAVSAIQSNDQQLQGLVVGYAWGTIDFVAGLLCFIGHPQCACMQNIVHNQPEALGREYGTQLVNCVNSSPGSAVYGPASRAASKFCPF